MKSQKKYIQNINNKTIIILLLVIIIGVGIFFRVWDLGKESYWVDEAISVDYAQKNYSDMSYNVQQDIHPPLHTLILYAWVRLFGISPESTRSLSVIFGIISIGIAFLIGKKLFNDEIGLIFAALMAFSPLMIYYSQEARSYSLLVCLTLISIYYFLKVIEESKISNILLYTIATLALLYTHVFAVLIVFVQNVFYFYFNRLEIKKIFSGKKLTNFRKWILTQLTIILLFFPWILVILKQMKHTYYTSWIPMPDEYVLAGTIKEFFGNIFILSIFCILVIYFLIKYLYEHKTKKIIEKKNKNSNNIINKLSNKDIFIFLLIWIIVPFIIVLTYSWTVHPFYQTRYLMFTLPAIYLLFGWIIVKLIINKYLKYLLIASILIASIYTITIQANTLQKDDWKGISAYLKINAKENEIIFIHPYYHQNVFAYYYERSCYGVYDDYGCMSNKNVLSLNWKETNCTDTTILTSRTSKNTLKDYVGKDIWLVSVRPTLKYEDDCLYKYFSEHKKLISTKEFTQGVMIYKFE